MTVQEKIQNNKTYLGIEFGSTRIKAVLIDDTFAPIASGSHDWVNRYENGIWTYSREDMIEGLRDCYAKLAADVKEQYGIVPESYGAMGKSERYFPRSSAQVKGAHGAWRCLPHIRSSERELCPNFSKRRYSPQWKQ